MSFAAALVAAPALAGTVDVVVDDPHGAPAVNAVVELVSDSPASLPASHLANEAVIDQQHETFIPLVSVVRKGGHVVFTNNDTTMHQVYSFSSIKQFQFEIDQGQRSEPVAFDKPGVASIGCNIHDQMITYVYVADSPFAAITDARGHANFKDVPAGAYRAKIWHPQLLPGDIPPSPQMAVTSSPASASVTIQLLPPPRMKSMHMGQY